MVANRSDQREPPRRMSGGASPRQRPATTFDEIRRPLRPPYLPPAGASSLRVPDAVSCRGTIADVKTRLADRVVGLQQPGRRVAMRD